jgi:maltooligosyltrehalose trehalohydrolase
MEFSSFGWQGIVPDPQDEATFLSAKLRHEVRDSGVHKILLEFYRGLLKLRKTIPALAQTDKDRMAVNGYPKEKILAVERWCSEHRALMVANLGAAENSVAVSITQRHWRKAFDSAAPQWRGSAGVLPDELDGGNDCQFSIGAHSVVLYLTEDVS